MVGVIVISVNATANLKAMVGSPQCVVVVRARAHVTQPVQHCVEYLCS